MILAILLLIIPAIIILLAQHIKLLDKLGVVILCFGLGFLVALTVDLKSLFGTDATMAIQINVSEIAVALALPLVLFSMNVKKAISLSGDALKAMGLALVSVVLVSIAGVLLFADKVTELWQVAGMSVGAYTGSGVNMGAIKTAIGGDQDIFLSMITYDIIFSGIYMLVVLSIGQRLAGLILRPYEFKGINESTEQLSMDHLSEESAQGYKRLVHFKELPGTLIAFLASAATVGASVGIASLLPESYSSIMTIVLISTFGILGSFIPALHKLKTSFHLGMYLILVFCLTSASMMDANIFTNIDWGIGGYIVFMLTGSVILHAILCRFTKIDRDTFLITSGAAIMSVPFIPVIAGALKNREILIPGFAVAIIGYAVGNYLGILVASVTQWITG